MGFRYQPVVRHARFVYSPYTSDEMLGFGELLADTIRQRIQSGMNIYDQAAAALKPGRDGHKGYPDMKTARGLQPIRDWTWTGHTLRCLKVLVVNENRATVGFLDESLPGRMQTASEIAFYGNQIERMWGVSERDRAITVSAMENYRPLVVAVDGANGMDDQERAAVERASRGFRQIGAQQYFSGLKRVA